MWQTYSTSCQIKNLLKDLIVSKLSTAESSLSNGLTPSILTFGDSVDYNVAYDLCNLVRHRSDNAWLTKNIKICQMSQETNYDCLALCSLKGLAIGTQHIPGVSPSGPYHLDVTLEPSVRVTKVWVCSGPDFTFVDISP